MTVPEGDEVRRQVAAAYGARVRPVLAESESPGAACCGPDCCSSAGASGAVVETVPVVGEHAAAACCGSDCCGAGSGDRGAEIVPLYGEGELAGLPESVTGVAFGCGNPTAIDALQPGETVLDLGSGGGIDCFLAAKAVGPGGHVVGVDMTPEMLALARKNAAKVGATNVEFRLGEIEHLPLADASVDVIISNCVINLSPEKPQVFREAFRVLRPGGRMQVSDIVWTQPPPEGLKDDIEQWAGCIAGAVEEGEYVRAIEEAGFVSVRSSAAVYPGRGGLASAAVTAVKPAGPAQP